MNPKNLKYHREHDWARVEGESAIFGLTSYAQETLGDIVYIELPEVGADVTAGTPYAEVESVKAVSDVYETGTALIKGEYWEASSDKRIEKDRAVRVVQVEGLKIKVEEIEKKQGG